VSTIKSSAEDLTINADGSNEIKFQINAVEKASINSSGLLTSTTIDATVLTGNLPAISGASLTGLTSPAITKVTKAYQSSTRSAFSDSRDLYANNLGFVGHKVGFSFTKDDADTDILVHFSMSVTNFNDCYSTAIYTGSSGAASGLVRWAFAGRDAIGDTDPQDGMIVSGHAVITGLSAAGHQYYWSMGRLNDAYNSQYTLNPDTNDDAQFGGATTSTIMVYEGDFD